MPKSFRNCEIVQQLKYIDGGIVSFDKVLKNCDSVDKYAYIVHDKDTNPDGTPKEPHIHVAVSFKTPRKLETISKIFDIQEHYISSIKGRWGDMLAYLTHSNATEKHQYETDLVVSNFDFVAESKNTTKSRTEERAELENILGKIVNGEIRKFNYTQHIDGTMYIKYKRQIETAFDYRADSIRGVDRNMECIYITGDSGTGKTTYAKEFAKRQKYSLFISSGSTMC